MCQETTPLAPHKIAKMCVCTYKNLLSRLLSYSLSHDGVFPDTIKLPEITGFKYDLSFLTQ